MPDGFDFLSACSIGTVLRTRDRRAVVITRVDREAGLIHGDVEMLGACSWRANGIYSDAPAGAAGPLDLVPPSAGSSVSAKRTKVADELTEAALLFCCD